jgi:hypothetical protein
MLSPGRIIFRPRQDVEALARRIAVKPFHADVEAPTGQVARQPGRLVAQIVFPADLAAKVPGLLFAGVRVSKRVSGQPSFQFGQRDQEAFTARTLDFYSPLIYCVVDRTKPLPNIKLPGR